MNGLEACLQDMMSLLTGGIRGIAPAIGGGLKDLVTEVFLETGADGQVQGISVVAGVACCFGGIALCVGLSSRVVAWVTNLGGGNL